MQTIEVPTIEVPQFIIMNVHLDERKVLQVPIPLTQTRKSDLKVIEKTRTLLIYRCFTPDNVCSSGHILPNTVLHRKEIGIRKVKG